MRFSDLDVILPSRWVTNENGGKISYILSGNWSIGQYRVNIVPPKSSEKRCWNSVVFIYNNISGRRFNKLTKMHLVSVIAIVVLCLACTCTQSTATQVSQCNGMYQFSIFLLLLLLWCKGLHYCVTNWRKYKNQFPQCFQNKFPSNSNIRVFKLLWIYYNIYPCV